VTDRDTSLSPPHPHDTPLQRFGATLRQYQQQRRLSHKALAARTGIRPSYIIEIELGKRNIAVLALLRLARALDIPAAWLLAGLDTRTTVPPPMRYEPLPSRGMQDTPVIHDTTPSLPPDDKATLLALLGTTLRQYRQQLGLTHQGLAARTGLTPTYIGEIERGQRNLSILSLIRIADALELSTAHLLAPLETRQSPSSPPTE